MEKAFSAKNLRHLLLEPHRLQKNIFIYNVCLFLTLLIISSMSLNSNGLKQWPCLLLIDIEISPVSVFFVFTIVAYFEFGRYIVTYKWFVFSMRSFDKCPNLTWSKTCLKHTKINGLAYSTDFSTIVGLQISHQFWIGFSVILAALHKCLFHLLFAAKVFLFLSYVLGWLCFSSIHRVLSLFE